MNKKDIVFFLLIFAACVGIIILAFAIAGEPDPARCDIGPMEAAQCRSWGLHRTAEGWK